MKIQLIRNDKSKEATFGELLIDETFFCCTLEELWRNNHYTDPHLPEAERSCVPPGKYYLRKRHSDKLGKNTQGYTPHIIGPPPINGPILIHAGHTVEDTLGGIVVGTRYGIAKSRYSSFLLDAVMSSRSTFIKLMKELENSIEWINQEDIYVEIVGVGTIDTKYI